MIAAGDAANFLHEASPLIVYRTAEDLLYLAGRNSDIPDTIASDRRQMEANSKQRQ
jgi:hypothetical protein